MQKTLAALSCALLTGTFLPAQRVLWFQNGQQLDGRFGSKLIDAGDVDGDGIHDLLVTEPGVPGSQGSPEGHAHLFSGQSGALLHTFSIATPNSAFGADATGIADVNGDGVRDIAIGANGLGQIYVFSGASGALFRVAGSTQIQFGKVLCDAGDVNGDGRGDIVTTTRGTVIGASGYGIGVVNSFTGGLLVDRLGTLPDVTQTQMRVLGDLDNDGHAEILVGSSHYLAILSLHPTATLRTITPPAAATNSFGRAGLGFADLDGDGVPELLVADFDARVAGVQGAVFIVDPVSGSTLGSVPIGTDESAYWARALVGIGDLDGDGREEVILGASIGNGPDVLQLAFGRDLHRSSYWSATPPFALRFEWPRAITQLGDVDGDGFADFATGDEWNDGGRGQVVVLSGRLLAQVRSIGTGCGGGPFIPQLGLTRPVLGQIAQIIGRDLPAGAPGLLAFSLQPHATTNLGIIGCEAAFDLGNWTTLALLPPSSSLSMPLPIPLLPQLAGIEIALQTLHFGTGGALGVDLSNGIWARIGY